MSEVRISDIIVPESFAPYVQVLTETKSRLVQSGVLARSPALDMKLAGGGKTFNAPSWNDIPNDADRVSSDDPAVVATPAKITANDEVAVRLSRNQSWKTSDLAGDLAGDDPAERIAARVAGYWIRRLQAAFVATWQGVFADNADATPNGQGAQNDLTHDIKGASYSAGVTDFSAEAFIDAATTAGDSADDFTAVFVHSIVYSRMQKNNLIDFIPDSQGVVMIPTFLGREVIVDDGMPNTSGVFETWLFGPGSSQLGMGSPKVPAEVERYPGQGNGGGFEELFSRTEWAIHPNGHAFIMGAIPGGGPSNANLADGVNNWSRVYPERKQIKVARLITRES